ncbi:SH3 domain-containing protein [Aminobacter carboxidus]|uniref:SH3 domain-containing protein n=2 Tax=Aminobacter carboxidus TaxID=376165 RepID=A0ABR9GVB9_9HYPH|nr:SH3 domain-containing protein [Aminobacter carboxidus]
MRRKSLLLALMLALAPAAPHAAGAQEQRIETLRMRPGATQTTVRGIVFGRISASYRLEARGGQRMSLNLNSRNTFLYFNVLDPRGRTIAREQTQWDGRLPVSGVYSIQIYLVRAEARRNRPAPFSLDVRIAGRGDGPGPAPDPEPAPGPRSWRVVGVATDDVLNLRENPSPRGFVLDEIPFDATGLRNLGCQDDRNWCKVRYRGQEGWVNGRFLRPE